jgi:hypothetical protein
MISKHWCYDSKKSSSVSGTKKSVLSSDLIIELNFVGTICLSYDILMLMLK